MVSNVRLLPARNFGRNWYSPPPWACAVSGNQSAVEVRAGDRDVSSMFARPQIITVYSVKTDQGQYWSMTGTSGTWQQNSSHVF